MTRKDAWCLLLYATLAVAIGFADLRMRAHTAHVVESFIPGVIANTEFAPGKYRVLAPYLVHAVAVLTGASPLNIWYATRLIWIFVALAATHAYLRTWFPPQAAFAGVALTAASLPLTFTNSWPHPDHIPELALFALAAMAIARRQDGWFGVALAAAAFNRETSVFLVLLYAVAEPLTATRVRRSAFFAGEWFAIYAGLRAVRGLQHYDYWQAARNLSDLTVPLPAALYDPYYRLYAYFGIALFGPMLYLAVTHLRHLPGFPRRALLVVPALVLVAFLFSNIIEARIFTPLYALILPAVVSVLFSPSLDTDRSLS
jgi:hypothetical protein